MVKIAVSEGGDPSIGKLFSYQTIEAANSSSDIFVEDPVFGEVKHLRDFYANSDLQVFARRFCTRISSFEDLWSALQSRAVPGNVGETQLSRKSVMSEEVKSEEKKAKKVKAPKGEKEPKVLREAPKKFSKESILTVTAAENPKRGESAKRFDSYVSGQPVSASLAAGVSMGDVRWDYARGWIDIDFIVDEAAAA